uniref:(northern house mosquito) hypothetical protein n=1 Tax=Culex pipiens TaxID=7175 RepID=A0A8D8G6J0_CULPI
MKCWHNWPPNWPHPNQANFKAPNCPRCLRLSLTVSRVGSYQELFNTRTCSRYPLPRISPKLNPSSRRSPPTVESTFSSRPERRANLRLPSCPITASSTTVSTSGSGTSSTSKITASVFKRPFSTCSEWSSVLWPR